ncbi:hypothetical protein B0H63DRAFT_529354 [Podospora didyma]|uniref:RRM domain-containing protein n=1 Tax=Podospora didyma TaxID=330526 RepID=A0AAE0K155_9PEZI|nr:hypothetical protein B0H63DRAFT_529354 [Podospora didyma]
MNLNANVPSSRKVDASASRYHGIPGQPRNNSVDTFDSSNCAIHLYGLKRSITYHELLGFIRDIGRIFKCSITSSYEHRGGASATIGFFTAEAAQKFFTRYRESGFFGAKVVWPKRIRREPDYLPRNLSGVVTIRGSSNHISREAIDQVLKEKRLVHLLGRVEECGDANKCEISYHFCCRSKQADYAFVTLKEYLERKRIRKCVRLAYGLDPCAMGDMRELEGLVGEIVGNKYVEITS